MKFSSPLIPKPQSEQQESIINALAALKALPQELIYNASLKPVDRRINKYITVTPHVQALLKRAKLVAFRPEPVLICGESGTGKELLARVLLGNRPDSDFHPINCGGIVDTLFESLLFGHVRGAFTNAIQDKAGVLVTAGTGVAFMDEVGELPLSQQAKLLRALQENKVMPVGSPAEVPIRCRFVFATNRNLEAMVAEGTFREDLYFRISPLTLTTFPLRERPDDAAAIMDAYCREKELDPPDGPIPHHIIQSKGNIRALQNWILQQHVWGPDES